MTRNLFLDEKDVSITYDFKPTLMLDFGGTPQERLKQIIKLVIFGKATFKLWRKEK